MGKITIHIQTLNLTIQNQDAMALSDIIAQLTDQSQKLDTVAQNITNIGTDVANLKQQIADLQAGAVTQEQLDSLTALANSMGSKIDTLTATTADLDAQTP